MPIEPSVIIRPVSEDEFHLIDYEIMGVVFSETFEKCSILAKIKEGENFNHRNILNISRIEI